MCPPWYEKILRLMDYGQPPLQRYCDDPYSPIVTIHGAYERREIKLGSVGRTKSFVNAHALKNLRKILKHSKTHFGIILNTHISIKSL